MTLPPFAALLRAHGTDVHRFLVALLGRERAEDAFQETFLAALRAYPRLRDASNLRAWLLTIAHRKAMDEHRADARRARLAIDPPAPPEPDPELWDAVRGLPEGQRAAVLLRFAHDLPYRQVAAVLRCSEAAARQRVHAGVRTLREVLA